jgi:hypothetical protein
MKRHDHAMSTVPSPRASLAKELTGEMSVVGMANGSPGNTAGSEPTGLLVVDSCHSTWLFDAPARRFRRILKGLDVDPALAATDWRPYERLEFSEGSDAFIVLLNEAGTRRIRSWRHIDGCEQCEGERTSELSVEDILRLAHA